jgi:hypothetical protein
MAGVCVLVAGLLAGGGGAAVAIADTGSTGSAAHGDDGPNSSDAQTSGAKKNPTKKSVSTEGKDSSVGSDGKSALTKKSVSTDSEDSSVSSAGKSAPTTRSASTDSEDSSVSSGGKSAPTVKSGSTADTAGETNDSGLGAPVADVLAPVADVVVGPVAATVAPVVDVVVAPVADVVTPVAPVVDVVAPVAPVVDVVVPLTQFQSDLARFGIAGDSVVDAFGDVDPARLLAAARNAMELLIHLKNADSISIASRLDRAAWSAGMALFGPYRPIPMAEQSFIRPADIGLLGSLATFGADAQQGAGAAFTILVATGVVPISLAALAVVALSGAGGLVVFTAAGVHIGYRQAKFATVLPTARIACFTHPAVPALAVVRSGPLIVVRPRRLRVVGPVTAGCLDKVA